jgi:hypothetical protein
MVIQDSNMKGIAMRSLLDKTVILGAGILLLMAAGLLVADEISPPAAQTEPVIAERATDHQIESEVLSVGGTEGNSDLYILRGTATQAAVSSGSSESYVLEHGFWHGYCVPGDADMSGNVDIDDVVYLIAYIFTGGTPPAPMDCCGDADASCNVDIDDVVYLIAYIFSGGPVPATACYVCGLF